MGKYWIITEQVAPGKWKGFKGAYLTEGEAERARLLVCQQEPDKFWIIFSVDENTVKATINRYSKKIPHV